MSATVSTLHAISATRGDLIAEVLKERILGGAYEPGKWLREAELRAEFGLSNGPVRDALLALVSFGLAERIPGRGVRVVEHSKEQILVLFQLRLALLQYAAERAARLADDRMLRRGRRMLKELTDTIDAARANKRQQRFTGELARWLIEAGGNSLIEATWQKAVLRTHIHLNATLKRTGATRLKPLLRELVDAIGRHDPAGAREAVRRITVQNLSDLGFDDPESLV